MLPLQKNEVLALLVEKVVSHKAVVVLALLVLHVRSLSSIARLSVFVV
jgi:hypothetical protein